MRKWFNLFITHFGVILLMLVFWLGFSPVITWQTVVTGFFISAIIKGISDYLFRDIYHFYVDFHFIGGFFFYLKNLIKNIFISAFKIVPIVFFHQDQPIIFNVHLSTKDPLVVTLVANAITLTPGTITLEVGDNNILSVLSIVDDGQHGLLLAQEILVAYQHPFHKALYRGVEQ